MTESPRRPPMNEWSKTGYRSYASPNDRLSNRLGASLPNLEQPALDNGTAINPNRTTSLRKMTPEFGQCWWMKGFKMNEKFSQFFWLPLSPYRVEAPSETSKGFPSPGLPPSTGISLRPELLFWYGCFPGESYQCDTTWGVCSAGQVLWGEELLEIG